MKNTSQVRRGVNTCTYWEKKSSQQELVDDGAGSDAEGIFYKGLEGKISLQLLLSNQKNINTVKSSFIVNKGGKLN